MLFAGLIDRQRIEDGFPYDMETVRQPRERIQRYEEGTGSGPDDIALIRTKQPITFIQDKVSLVRKGYNPYLILIVYRIGNIK